MSNMQPEPCKCSNRSGMAWLTVFTAVGITAAAALIITKKLRASDVRAGVEDIIDACERAAQTLEDRLGLAAEPILAS